MPGEKSAPTSAVAAVPTIYGCTTAPKVIVVEGSIASSFEGHIRVPDESDEARKIQRHVDDVASC